MVTRSFWVDKKVFITGDTGFKGSWLRLWLEDMGAIVRGYSLNPPSIPNLTPIFRSLTPPLTEDLRNEGHLAFTLRTFAPDYVIHLGAQAHLPLSYEEPVMTFDINVMGTLYVLNAIREYNNNYASRGKIKGALFITTDKVYKIPSDESIKYFREDDPLGGFDPYSASKVCAEHIIKCYRNCFIKDIPLYVARAGNVIGGGDFARGRLIPDTVHAIYEAKSKVILRSPNSVRPWQHVFDALCGYLMLLEQAPDGDKYGWEWNFGPKEIYPYTVKDVVELFGAEYDVVESDIHETALLCLSSNKARDILDWGTMSTMKGLEDTKAWYEKYYERVCNMRDYSLCCLQSYEEGEYFD
jgi:CDP-glucose 4,6-dehydratase